MSEEEMESISQQPLDTKAFKSVQFASFNQTEFEAAGLPEQTQGNEIKLTLHKVQFEQQGEEDQRQYPVIGSLVGGGVLGILVSMFFFAGAFVTWGLLGGAMVGAIVGSREDEVGESVRSRSIWARRSLAKVPTRAAAGLHQAQEKMRQLNEEYQVKERMDHAKQSLVEGVQPKAEFLVERVAEMDTHNVLGRTKDLLVQANDKIGLSRSANAIWSELKSE